MKQIQSYTSHQQTGILLNANESTYRLEESVIEVIQESIQTMAFNRYPDTDCQTLKEIYAKRIGKSPEQIVVGNGSDQILGLLIGSFLGKNKILYTLDPDFSMYDYYASMYDAQVKKYSLDDFSMDSFIEDGKEADMILFSNPNNPSGNYIEKKDIQKLIEAFPNIPIVIDEAYAEFSNEDCLDLIELYPNVYITRTLSKAYALAGIRVGFLISSKENIKNIHKKMVPYSVSCIDQKIAEIVLQHPKGLDEEIQRIKTAREQILQNKNQFKKMQFIDSQANFICVKSPNIQEIIYAFEQSRIQIRKFSGKDYCRITIGTNEEIQAVWNVLKEVEERL